MNYQPPINFNFHFHTPSSVPVHGHSEEPPPRQEPSQFPQHQEPPPREQQLPFHSQRQSQPTPTTPGLEQGPESNSAPPTQPNITHVLDSLFNTSLDTAIRFQFHEVDSPARTRTGLTVSGMVESTFVGSITEEMEEASQGGFCTICHSGFFAGDVTRTVNNCEHRFHIRCLEQWLASNHTCPNCRRSLVEPQPQHL